MICKLSLRGLVYVLARSKEMLVSTVLNQISMWLQSNDILRNHIANFFLLALGHFLLSFLKFQHHQFVWFVSMHSQ